MFKRDTYKPFSNRQVQEIIGQEKSPLSIIYDKIKERSKVLDIGAGNGIMGYALSNNKYCTVDGIEPDPKGSYLAEQYYRNFYTEYFQNIQKELSSNQYDYIILADVIEHVVDPLLFMQQLKDIMWNNTTLLLDTPNITFAAVPYTLAKGQFFYTQSGLWEATHLRFFSYDLLLKLFENAGFYVKNEVFIQRSVYNTEFLVNRGISDYLLLRKLQNHLFANTYQFFFQLSLVQPFEKSSEFIGYKDNLFYECFIRKKLEKAELVKQAFRHLRDWFINNLYNNKHKIEN